MDAPRAPRRRARRRRHRHPRPGRVADRDGPPPGARPHHRAAPPAGGGQARPAPTQRAERERAHLPTVALAGYTNAGKSTLLNALTGGERLRPRPALPHARPDHAHDRSIEGRTYLMTDTVGFIRKLPHGLVEAFARHARGDDPRRPRPARRRRVGAARRSSTRCCAPSTTCSRRSAPATGRACSCSTRPTRSTTTPARAVASATRSGVLVSALTGEGLDELRDAHRRRVREPAGRRRAARAVPRGRRPLRAARARRRPRARGHAGRRARRGPPARAGGRALRALLAPTASRCGFRRLDPAAVLPRRAHPGDAGYDLCALDALVARAGRAGDGPHGDRDRAARRPRRLGRAPLRPRRAPRHRARQRAGSDRRRLPRRGQGPAAQHGPRGGLSRSSPGERIAQLVVAAVAAPEVVEVDTLSDSARGAGGFGSTGR